MKISLCVTLLATIWVSVLADSHGNPPPIPSCEQLKGVLVRDGGEQTDAEFKCGDDGESL